MDSNELDFVIASLLETFGKEVTPMILMGYWMGLDDLPLQVVKDAVSKAVRAFKFLPTVAELRELAGVKAVPPEALGAEAWERVMREIRDTGSYGNPVFDDPNIATAINRMGGWQSLCGGRESEWLHKWGKKEFISEYSSVAMYGASPSEQTKRLEGRHAQSRQLLAKQGDDIGDGRARVESIISGIG